MLVVYAAMFGGVLVSEQYCNSKKLATLIKAIAMEPAGNGCTFD
jgi:hypothetical protein